MFLRVPIGKKNYAINLDKVLYFYPYKADETRFELEDGSILDVKISFDEISLNIKSLGQLYPFVFVN